MDLDKLKDKVADILVSDVDWDEIASLVADNIRDDFNQAVADKIVENLSADDVAQTVVDGM